MARCRGRLIPLLALAVVVAAPPSALGAQGSALTGRMEVVVSGEEVRARAGSPFARIAGLPDSAWAAELRPDATWESGGVSLTAKPRAVVEGGGAERESRFFLNEGWLRLRPRPGLSLQAGREVLLWGPAMFWNPSNPFYVENNRANPQRDLGGLDVIRGRWQISRAWSATAIAQVGRGRAAVAADRRKGLKIDWVGDSASAGFVAASTSGERLGLYVWGQATVSDALLLYGEAGWSEGSATLLPERFAGPTGWILKPARAEGRTVKGLVGGSYTLLNGVAVAVEVWRNGDGWDGERRAQVAEALGALVRQPFGAADGQIGALFTAVPEPYGRLRAGVQIMNAGEGRFSWLVRSTHGLDEGGRETLGYVRRDLSDSLQVWASAAWRHGGPTSGYGRSVRSAASIGLTWLPW